MMKLLEDSMNMLFNKINVKKNSLLFLLDKLFFFERKELISKNENLPDIKHYLLSFSISSNQFYSKSLNMNL